MSLRGDFIRFVRLLRVDDGDRRSDCSCVGSFFFLFVLFVWFVAGY